MITLKKTILVLGLALGASAQIYASNLCYLCEREYRQCSIDTNDSFECYEQLFACQRQYGCPLEFPSPF